MQAAFEVGEADRHRLDPALVGQVVHAGFLDLARVLPRQAVGLGLKVHLFELVVGDFEEVAEGGSHVDLLV